MFYLHFSYAIWVLTEKNLKFKTLLFCLFHRICTRSKIKGIYTRCKNIVSEKVLKLGCWSSRILQVYKENFETNEAEPWCNASACYTGMF